VALRFFHPPAMDDETENTAVDIANLLESPTPPSQRPSQPSEQEQTLEDILAQSSTDLIHAFAASINHSAVKEASKTEEFREGICKRNAHICWFLLTAYRVQTALVSVRHEDVCMVDRAPRTRNGVLRGETRTGRAGFGVGGTGARQVISSQCYDAW
jgi:hypothetical protein